MIHAKPIIATVLLSSAFLVQTAQAQFFPRQLPQNDFTWTWGDPERAANKFEDFSMRGGEGGFNCELAGGLSPVSRLTRMDVRQLEDELRQNMFFVQAASNLMYQLDARRDIEWATLACAKPQTTRDQDEEARAEREARALERARRELERRRARQARDEED